MWRLPTHRSVDTPEQATQLIDGYHARWEIEMFLEGLASFCKYVPRSLSRPG
jgi:hypothetical protein